MHTTFICLPAKLTLFYTWSKAAGMRHGNTRTRFNTPICLSWSFSYVMFVCCVSVAEILLCMLTSYVSAVYPLFAMPSTFNTIAWTGYKCAQACTTMQKNERRREREKQFARISKMNVICRWKYFCCRIFVQFSYDRNAMRNTPDDSHIFFPLGGCRMWPIEKQKNVYELRTKLHSMS